jgi:chitinase
MATSRLAIISIALAVSAGWSSAQQVSGPQVVGYVFPQNTTLQPGQIDPHGMTRINFAFANISAGRMVTGFANDSNNLAYVTALRKKNPSLSVLISVGGWLWSTDFSDVSVSKESRKRFIESVMDFIARYDLDGLDIDWEYPGMTGAGHPFRSEDKQNFTLLVKEIREQFDQASKKSGRRRYLTIAAGSSDEFLAHTEMANVQKYVDTVNLMAYDYYEPGSEAITGHHAPLFASPADPMKVSADASVRAFEQAGVPAARILLGVPFYGHMWGEVADQEHGLFQAGKPIPGADSTYGVIVTSMLDHGFTRYWDPVASVPYLYSAEKHIFVSYEDEQSLAAKCKYVLMHKLGGVMFWDYSADPTGKLLGAINASLGRR